MSALNTYNYNEEQNPILVFIKNVEFIIFSKTHYTNQNHNHKDMKKIYNL